MLDAEPLFAVAAILILLAVGASKISSRLGVPALLVFIGIGMLAGGEGVGGIQFDDYRAAQSVGIVALAFILFSGGLDTDWGDVRPVLGKGLVLATVGVIITAGVTGATAAWVVGLPLSAGLLLGAIVSSTDAAAVFSVLGSSGVRLRRRISPLLELESGANDPMAVFLTVALLAVITEDDADALHLVPLFFQQLVVGGVGGYVLARLAVALLRRIDLEQDGLYPVVTLAVVLGVYGSTTLLGGSGFLAVYVAGLVLGNSRIVHKRSLSRFHDALAWLCQIAMFLVLGLLVNPSDLLDVALPALAVSAVLIAVARPVSVFASLPTRSIPWRDRALVSWVGLRGAVPIILATFPLVEGIENGNRIFNVVFFIVLTSVLVQGTTVAAAARWLGVGERGTDRPSAPLELVGAEDAMDLREHVVVADAPVAGRRLVELDLPEGCLVVLVERDGEHVVPQGGTRLEPGDSVLVLAPPPALAEVRRLFDVPAPG